MKIHFKPIDALPKVAYTEAKYGFKSQFYSSYNLDNLVRGLYWEPKS
ncbi:hypothetical protein PAENIP36_04010 [Paenibacillus sp. P36]